MKRTVAEAQVEIVRRLNDYGKKHGLTSKIAIIEFDAGILSEEELVKMITQHEDGSVFMEPTFYNEWKSELEKGIEHEFDSRHMKYYEKQIAEAAQLIKDYQQ